MGSWSADFQEQLSGSSCMLCSEGRPEEIGSRIRFYASETADAYLHSRGIQRGYCVVIWRGRHVVEPTDLSDDEAAAFWLDMVRVSHAMQEVYRPLKMNYQILGNRIAHLHWILAPRFLDDVAPGDPLSGSGYHAFPKDEVRQDVAALREAVMQG
ncbi:HIT domain-containing protein [Candidatus Leptofilum sp.]|uniref:HIT family protein n=1 Tax=Candidatus Leptofilum sp. TaxID=3241576 RepID=UPI003B590B06